MVEDAALIYRPRGAANLNSPAGGDDLGGGFAEQRGLYVLQRTITCLSNGCLGHILRHRRRWPVAGGRWPAVAATATEQGQSLKATV